MIVEMKCADCGLPITFEGPEEVVGGIVAEEVLCQRCDPDFASLLDNKHQAARADE